MLKVYLTDLAAYNSGFLVGKFISLPMSEETLHMAINEVLTEGESITKEENHEEWFITDYEWDDLEFCQVDEYENIFELNSNMELLSGLETSKLKSVAFLLNEGITVDIEDAIQRAEDVIIHNNQDMEDVAYSLLEECYGVYKLDPIIANNIDYERVAERLESDGTYWEIGDDVFEYIG